MIGRRCAARIGWLFSAMLRKPLPASQCLGPIRRARHDRPHWGRYAARHRVNGRGSGRARKLPATERAIACRSRERAPFMNVRLACVNWRKTEWEGLSVTLWRMTLYSRSMGSRVVHRVPECASECGARSAPVPADARHATALPDSLPRAALPAAGKFKQPHNAGAVSGESVHLPAARRTNDVSRPRSESRALRIG